MKRRRATPLIGTCAYAYSMVKVISLSEEAYRELRKKKSRSESFSEVILRLLQGRKRSLVELGGSWVGDDLAHVEEALKKERHSVVSRELEL